MPKLMPYSKKLDYSYALGLFPSLTLAEVKPDVISRLLLDPEGLDNKGVEKLREICRGLGVREELAERVIKRESGKDNCYAALVFRKYESELLSECDHAVLAQISDLGNVGTALRSLLGFGFRDVALIRPCADVFEPHTIRASMGAMFKLRVTVYDSFEEYRTRYPKHELYPFMLKGAKRLNDVAPNAKHPYSLIFGNEQTGLPDSFAHVGQSVFIPQTSDIDSLNLGVAVAIGAYAFRNC